MNKIFRIWRVGLSLLKNICKIKLKKKFHLLEVPERELAAFLEEMKKIGKGIKVDKEGKKIRLMCDY